MRQRLKGIVERLRVARPDELAGQFSLLINGAFVSSQIFEPGEAMPLLRRTQHTLIGASRTWRFPYRIPGQPVRQIEMMTALQCRP